MQVLDVPHHCEHLGAQAVKNCQIKEERKHPYIDPKCYYSYTSTICTHDLKKRHKIVSQVLLSPKKMRRPLPNAECGVKHSGEMVTIGSVFPRPTWDPISDKGLFLPADMNVPSEFCFPVECETVCPFVKILSSSELDERIDATLIFV